MIKPFLKWVGGKGRLLPFILENLPLDMQVWKATGEGVKQFVKFDFNYAEPFVGGGAVYFGMCDHYGGNPFDRVDLTDNNERLMFAYSMVQYNSDTLFPLLEKLHRKYYSIKTMEGRANFYYEMRGMFNGLSSHDEMSAALLIFLNKTCYNGLYRTNRHGIFNVPFGKYKSPIIFDKDGLSDARSALCHIAVGHFDFGKTLQYIKSGTLVYVDPPYTTKFTEYQGVAFDGFDWARLMDYLESCDSIGARVMMSCDHDCRSLIPNDHGQWRIVSKKTKCTVEAHGSSVRNEYLIMNY